MDSVFLKGRINVCETIPLSSIYYKSSHLNSIVEHGVNHGIIQ